MTILPICITGEPVLHRLADPVESFDSALADLVADMTETMHAAPRRRTCRPAGRCRPASLRLVVSRRRNLRPRYAHELQLDRGPERGFNDALSGVVINPTLDLVWDDAGAGAILEAQPDMVCESEGCLSVPGVQYPLRRALGAVLRGYDVAGSAITVAARGWLARIFQHEYDHLRGTLYVDRLDAPYDEAARAHVAERGWAPRIHVDPGGVSLAQSSRGHIPRSVSGPRSPASGSSCARPR